jgi:hypothetical protein
MSDERSGVLPQDEFSIELRKLTDNPGAVRASSTIKRIDFYGRTETWVLDTFRHDGQETIFVQRISARRAASVPDAAGGHEGVRRPARRAVTSVRKRGARKAAATAKPWGSNRHFWASVAEEASDEVHLNSPPRPRVRRRDHRGRLHRGAEAYVKQLIKAGYDSQA